VKIAVPPNKKMIKSRRPTSGVDIKNLVNSADCPLQYKIAKKTPKNAIPNTVMNPKSLQCFTIDFPTIFDCSEEIFLLSLKWELVIPHIPAMRKTVPTIEKKEVISPCIVALKIIVKSNRKNIGNRNIGHGKKTARKIIPRTAIKPYSSLVCFNLNFPTKLKQLNC